MSLRLTSYAVFPTLFIAGGLALYGFEHASEANPAAPPRSSERRPMGPMARDAPRSDNGDPLPPNHPPIGAMMSSHPSLPAASDEPAAIAWTVPEAWKVAPSPSKLRLVTYQVPGGVDVSVSRAGGQTESNIARWIDQFDDVSARNRVDKTIRGLQVVTVDVAGTYTGGGMAGTGGGAAAQTKPDWAMAGAIVESRSPSYFFKMTGPASAVRAARPAFDKLVDSILPL